MPVANRTNGVEPRAFELCDWFGGRRIKMMALINRHALPRPVGTVERKAGQKVPGFSCGKLNRPASSVLAMRLNPVSELAIVTMAPRTTAMDVSRTWPTIALVVSPSASAFTETRHATVTGAKPTSAY